MTIGGVGLLVVEESTGADSRFERVVEDGDGSSIRRAKIVCLWFRWGRGRYAMKLCLEGLVQFTLTTMVGGQRFELRKVTYN